MANKETLSESELPVLSPHVVAVRKFWYSKTFLLLEMIEHSKSREMVFLYSLNRKNNVRYLNAGSVEILMKYLGLQTNQEKLEKVDAKNPYNFLTDNKKNLNIYCSLATIDWKKCPVRAFSYAVGERIKQQNEFKKNIKTNLKEYITDFTGAIDLDGNLEYVIEDGQEKEKKLDITFEESTKRSLSDLKIIIDVLNEYKIKWRTHFSGTKGFHIFFEIPLEISAYQKREITNDIVKLFYETYELKTVDRAKYNTMKVMKTSYSLVTKNDISRVVLPLDDNQIKDFKLSEMECKWVYYNVEGLKNRGLLWHNTNIDKNQSIKNFMKFIDDMEIHIPEHREEEESE